MFVKIDIVDLSNLVNKLQLKEIAFTLPEFHENKYEFKGFNEILKISIEIKNCLNKCLLDLLDNFIACERLEFFSNNRLNLSLNHNFCHQFKNLKALIGSGSIYFNMDILEKNFDYFN